MHGLNYLSNENNTDGQLASHTNSKYPPTGVSPDKFLSLKWPNSARQYTFNNLFRQPVPITLSETKASCANKVHACRTFTSLPVWKHQIKFRRWTSHNSKFCFPLSWVNCKQICYQWVWSKSKRSNKNMRISMGLNQILHLEPLQVRPSKLDSLTFRMDAFDQSRNGASARRFSI